MNDKYQKYQYLKFDKSHNGVLTVTLSRPEKYNAADEIMHAEMARVWDDITYDDDVAVVLVTGSGKAFSSGGDLAMLERTAGDYSKVSNLLHEMSEIVYGMLRCTKPIVSAINGVAIGAGAAIALLADISICSEKAKIGDGHVNIGVAAGDHAAIIWPLLMSMAKVKYYTLTGELISGVEAERVGLVSKTLPHDEVLPHAREIASKLADGPSTALQLTKRALNRWIQSAAPIFDQSAAYEMLGFLGPDIVEGCAAIREKRSPVFKK